MAHIDVTLHGPCKRDATPGMGRPTTPREASIEVKQASFGAILIVPVNDGKEVLVHVKGANARELAEQLGTIVEAYETQAALDQAHANRLERMDVTSRLELSRKSLAQGGPPSLQADTQDLVRELEARLVALG